MASSRSQRRPGGRTARVRADVHAAVKQLLVEHAGQNVTIAMVAERSGVHQATLYRRWGTMLGLIEDVVTEQLAEASPVPDTGSLRGDLEQYASGVAADLADPLGAVLLRAAAVSPDAPSPDGPSPQRERYSRRVTQLQVMLDRATERGEHPPTTQELVEVLLMPMYGHLLFLRTPPAAEHALMLVDRLLLLAAARHERDATREAASRTRIDDAARTERFARREEHLATTRGLAAWLHRWQARLHWPPTRPEEQDEG